MKIAIFIFLISNCVYGFKLEPMVVDFSPDGKGATKMFRVENDGKDEVAVKIEAFVRQVDSQGKEKRIPTDHFKIFPAQTSIKAKDSRAVRVTYQGPKNLEGEGAYRIVATQLPVKFKKRVKQSGVQFMFRFMASVYVTSEQFMPKLEIDSVKRIEPERFRIKIANKGKKHRQLKGVRIILKDKAGQTLALNDSVVKNWSAGNILAGGERTFSFKSGPKAEFTKNEAEIEIKDGK